MLGGADRDRPRAPRFAASTLSLLALACWCAAPVAAQPTLLTNRLPLSQEQSQSSELAFAGDAALVGVWGGGTTNLIREYASGRPPASVARSVVASPSSEFGDSLTFAASETRLVVMVHGTGSSYKGSSDIHYESLLGGRIGSPLAELRGPCTITPSLDPSVSRLEAHTAVAAEGEEIAYDDYGCLIVVDYATGVKTTLALPATLEPVSGERLWRAPESSLLRLAGPLLAYRENPPGGEGPAQVVVYDLNTQSALYRVPLPAEPAAYERSSGPPTFGLEADGTLLIANPSGCQATISTSGEPAPRPFGVPACEIAAVRDGRALLSAPAAGGTREIAWTPLQQPVLHPIADTGAEGVLQKALPALNESEVLYAQAGCYTPAIYRTSLADPGVSPAPTHSCPVAAADAKLSSRSLTVRLHCPLGCWGNLSAEVGTAREAREGHGGQRVSDVLPNVSALPGDYETVALLPSEFESVTPAKLLARARRSAHLYLRLDMSIRSPTSQPGSEYSVSNESHPVAILPIQPNGVSRSSSVR